MHASKGIRTGASILLAVLLPIYFAGCAAPSLRGGKMPDWVREGSGAFSDSGKEVFYGVGAIVGVQNEPMARTAAENRARAEVGKIFETYTASLMKDYMASTAGGAAITAETPTSEEQHIEQSIKTFSSATLSGVVIVDHWIDVESATHYALARLDLESFKNSLERMQQLNSQTRQFIRENADRSFAEMAQEEERRMEGGAR